MSSLAFFWDESNIWGLMALRTLCAKGIKLDLVNAQKIRDGGLESHGLIFIPGGWSSDKIEALGVEGQQAVKVFVERGGNYLGVCGGSGMALQVDDGLALIPVSRGPGLSNFSGPIELIPQNGFPSSNNNLAFVTSVWWPAHFKILNDNEINIKARYGKPVEGFMVADLITDDVEAAGADWEGFEDLYGMQLNPISLLDTPAIVEGMYGKGKVVLSYPHLETPKDNDANERLVQLLKHLDPDLDSTEGLELSELAFDSEAMSLARDLYELGRRNFLWTLRNDWLLQWRRGVRGIEYNTILTMINSAESFGESNIEGELLNGLKVFFSKAKTLLMEERRIMSAGPLNPYKNEDPRLRYIREELFGKGRKPRGMYKWLLNQLDEIVYFGLKKKLGH